MNHGPLWTRMNAQQRTTAAQLSSDAIPAEPGVYAWYENGRPIYVGKANSLRNRVWKNHLGRGRVMTGSAFRRNVAEHLGISTAAAIKARAYQPDDEEVGRIRAFIERCEIAWLTAASPADAVALETSLKAEWRPPLTKR